MSAGDLYELLRDGIVRLTYPPGAPLFENALTVTSGLSRTPVRDVLKRLRDEGLVEVHPGRGSFVTPLDLDRTQEAIAMRLLLEGEAAERAAKSAGAKNLARELARIVTDQRSCLAARERDEVYRLDQRFHELIFRATGLTMMWSAVRIARAEMERAHHIASASDIQPRNAIRFHAQIRERIAAGDAAGAKAAMTAHIESNLDYLLEHLRQHSPSSGAPRL